jgi:hypothetical protein
MSNDSDVEIISIAETENYSIELERDSEGNIYHIHLDLITIHMLEEEFEEFKDLMKQLMSR